MPQIPRSKNLLIPVYIASLLYSFHYALPLYIESSFISQFLKADQAVGIIFAISALITILVTLTIPRTMRRFGNYRITRAAMVLEIAMLIILAFSSSAFLVIPAFIIHQALLSLLYLNLDTFLEAFSSDAITGGIRGVFLTIMNVAVAVAPFLAGVLLTDHDFWKVYLLSTVCMIGMYFVVRRNFKDYQDPTYTVPPFWETFRIVKNSHDLHSIIFIHFLLNFFYAWMVIYTPIYLNEHMGIAMSDILTFIMPIALIPFIVLQVFLGKIADNKLGEKEILTAGFLIMAIATAGLSFITTSGILIWTAVLFFTRVGASAVEVMAESYFYKKVGPDDMHLVTFMRTIRSAAYLVGPLVGALTLTYLDYRFLFVVLGAIMLMGVPYSLTIKDSR